MARASMTRIIEYTRRLVGNTEVGSPWSDNQIQDSLDQWRLHLEWILLDRDPDYHHYYSRSHHAMTTERRVFVDSTITGPDFSHFTRVGFYESDYLLREDRDATSAAYTPTSANVFDGSFVFSTSPNVDLYLFAKAYNVYQAAADLLSETPDFGRLSLKSWSRLGVSETYDTFGEGSKIMQYRKRGRMLNRQIPRLRRS